MTLSPGFTNATDMPVRATFNEPTGNFTVDDIQVTGPANITSFAAGTVQSVFGSAIGPTVYEFNVVPTEDGDISVQVPAAAANDAASNPVLASNTVSFKADQTLPTLNLSSAASEAVRQQVPADDRPDVPHLRLSPIGISVNASEIVSGLELADFVLSNGQIQNLTGSDADYALNLIPLDEGNVTLSLPAGVLRDRAENLNEESNELRFVFDTTRPTLTVSSTTLPRTGTFPIPLTFQFSEHVTGFTLADIYVSGGYASNFTGNQSTYQANFYPPDEGDFVIRVLENLCVDLAGNLNNESLPLTRYYDNTPPTVVIDSGANPNTNGSPIPIEIIFSEYMLTDSGTDGSFTITDIAVTNAVRSNFVAKDQAFTGQNIEGGTTYHKEFTVDLYPTGQGAVTVTVPAEVAVDEVTVSCLGSNTLTFNYDTVAPTVSEMKMLASVYGSGAFGDLTVDENQTVVLDTDATEEFNYRSITVHGTLTASGANPLILLSQTTVEVTGVINCGGQRGRNAGSSNGAGGGAGGGALKITTPELANSGTISVRGGRGGNSGNGTHAYNQTSSDLEDGDGGIARLGGLAGGAGGQSSMSSGTAGEGQGAGDGSAGSSTITPGGGGGSYRGSGQNGFPSGSGGDAGGTYGDPYLTTLHGGSGGGGGGRGSSTLGADGGGLGGSLWIQTEKLTNSGTILATGGNGGTDQTAGNNNGGAGGNGRIRMDVVSVVANTGTVSPAAGFQGVYVEPPQINSQPRNGTIIFSEDVFNFTKASIAVSPAGSVYIDKLHQVSNSVYLTEFTNMTDSNITSQVGAAAVNDVAVNPNPQGPALEFEFDSTRPQLTLSSTHTYFTRISPIPVAVAFTEHVEMFGVDDFTTRGLAAELESFEGYGSAFAVGGVPQEEGLLTVSVNESECMDLAANTNEPSNTLTFMFDTTQPTTTLTSNASMFENTSPIYILTTFSEPILSSTLAHSDYTVQGSASSLTAVVNASA